MGNFDFEQPLFWVALSAIATLLMTIVTFSTLIQNRNQLKELKRQWKDIYDAKLIFSIVSVEGMFHLKIQNIGKSVAFNIKLRICDTFINKLLFNGIKDLLISLSSNTFTLNPNQEKYFIISPIYNQGSPTIYGENFSYEEVKDNIDKIIFEPIIITGYYNDSYSINEKFTIDNFISTSILVDEAIVAQLKIIANTLIKK